MGKQSEAVDTQVYELVVSGGFWWFLTITNLVLLYLYDRNNA